MAMKRKNLPEVVPELFEHEQFGQFRFIKRGEEILFVAVDLCHALDIQNIRQNLANFPDDEKADVCITYTSSNGVKQRRNVLVVTEPGFYRLIFMSRKPEAEKIKHWVFHEVLPSIRKYGFYGFLNGEQIRQLPIREYVHYLGELTPEQYRKHLEQLTTEQCWKHYERLKENLPNMTQEEIKHLANDPCIIVNRVGHDKWKAKFFC